MINAFFNFLIKFNLKIVNIVLYPLIAVAKSIPGFNSLYNGTSYIAGRFFTYITFIEDLFFFPHSLLVLIITMLLFLIGLYQLFWFYNAISKILGVLRK